jgi:hypothetical protein
MTATGNAVRQSSRMGRPTVAPHAVWCVQHLINDWAVKWHVDGYYSRPMVEDGVFGPWTDYWVSRRDSLVILMLSGCHSASGASRSRRLRAVRQAVRTP